MQVTDFVELYFVAVLTVAAFAVLAEPLLLPLLHLLGPRGFSTAPSAQTADRVRNMPQALMRDQSVAETDYTLEQAA